MHWSSLVFAVSGDCVASSLAAEVSSLPPDPDRWDVCESRVRGPKTGPVKVVEHGRQFLALARHSQNLGEIIEIDRDL